MIKEAFTSISEGTVNAPRNINCILDLHLPLSDGSNDNNGYTWNNYELGYLQDGNVEKKLMCTYII